jgi:cytochrome c oxidase assembly protein subunit 15
MQRSGAIHALPLAALMLAFVVVVLGAYTRLTHAGLGCPDWPGCYGALVVPESVEAEGAAAHAIRPLDRDKAWTEMIHRYAAGTLGLLILAMAVVAWRRRRDPDQPVLLPLLLLALVVFQALLGMWTVTWLLKPAVVSAHLLGGLAVLALLSWLVLAHWFRGPPDEGARDNLVPWAVAALAVLAAQIFLGGWTSANYAALICPEFPACRGGEWWPPADFAEGFRFWRGIGPDYEGGVLDAAGRTAVHLAHRLGALAAAIVIGAAALRAMLGRSPRSRFIGAAVLGLLCLQIALGVSNVLLSLPLPVAVAHNATAALLLLALTALLRQAVINRSSR